MDPSTGRDQFRQACTRLYEDFFARFPNDKLHVEVRNTLALLLVKKESFAGALGGWAGGLVYAVGCTSGCGVPNVLNTELAAAFGVSMDSIRRRAWHIRRLLWKEYAWM